MKRLSIPIEDDLSDRIDKMPWGVRSSVIRALLTRVLDAADKKGSMIFGAVMSDEFDIIYKDIKK